MIIIPFNYRTGKFPDSARNRNPEEYKGTVFYRTFVLLAPFYNSATTCIYIYIFVHGITPRIGTY